MTVVLVPATRAAQPPSVYWIDHVSDRDTVTLAAELATYEIEPGGSAAVWLARTARPAWD